MDPDVGLAGLVEQRFEIDYSRFNRILNTVIGLGPRRSCVVIDETNLRVRMGWAFKAEIPLVNITRVGTTDRPFFAWGVHGWRGRWLINGSSNGIVAIEIDPRVRGWAMCFPLRLRTVYVSLADPDRFLHASTTWFRHPRPPTS